MEFLTEVISFREFYLLLGSLGVLLVYDLVRVRPLQGKMDELKKMDPRARKR